MAHETANVPVIIVPEQYTQGPAMSQLTENQQNFVWALLEVGGDQNKAALLAGLGGTEGSRKVAACRLMQHPKILAAIREMAEQRIKFGALLGASVLLEIANDPMHKDRMKAAVEIMDRSGMLVIRETKVTVEHKDPSLVATVARIRALAAGMNVDAKPMLLQAGVPQDIIDAEFEDVKMSAAGLEDLL